MDPVAKARKNMEEARSKALYLRVLGYLTLEEYETVLSRVLRVYYEVLHDPKN